MNEESIELPPDDVTLTITSDEAGLRLDVFLARQFPQFSRTQLRRAIDTGTVQVDGQRTKVAYKLVPGQVVAIRLPQLTPDTPVPEDLPLDVLFEDEDMAVINKPPGMVVHPAKGHWQGTLTSALAFRFASLSQMGGATRPGIVHRLDRDTSGVILVAKHDAAHAALAAQFEARSVFKEYWAICRGVPDRDRDRIDAPIGPHPHHREKMAIRPDHPDRRTARTEYEVDERFRGFSIVRAYPRTGRTHQIRLHLTHIGCPIVCDRLYGGSATLKLADLCAGAAGDAPAENPAAFCLDRQALHAKTIRVAHPSTGQSLVVEAPLPHDLQQVLAALRIYRAPERSQ